MHCAWQPLIRLLPGWMRPEVDKCSGKGVQEIRMRLGIPPELICQNGAHRLERRITAEDLRFVVNVTSQYSPWSAETVRRGYLCGPGGHRIGVFGEAAVGEGVVRGIRNVNALCIRVARDIPGVAAAADRLEGSILIIGKPGSGKTTLLRDLIRRRSCAASTGISVIDEKGELFPAVNGAACFETGPRTDILTGCGKIFGIEAALRNMSPSVIAVDEITAETDCDALIHAGWCGVSVFATAHAATREDLQHRPIYRRLMECGLFDNLIVLQTDKSWQAERMYR